MSEYKDLSLEEIMAELERMSEEQDELDRVKNESIENEKRLLEQELEDIKQRLIELSN